MQWGAVRSPCVRRSVDQTWTGLFMAIQPERPVDAGEPDLIAAVDALGVDGEQDFDAVPGPFRDLGRLEPE